MSQIKCNKSLILHILTVFIFFPTSLKKFDEMIEPFRLHEPRDSAQAEARRKEQPFKITDEELSTFKEKVNHLKLYIPLCWSGVANLRCCFTDQPPDPTERAASGKLQHGQLDLCVSVTCFSLAGLTNQPLTCSLYLQSPAGAFPSPAKNLSLIISIWPGWTS